MSDSKSIDRVQPKVAAVRRVVTGHDQQGRSVIIEDGPCAHVECILGIPTLASTELWTTQVPANNWQAGEGAVLPLVVAPPVSGAVFRVVEFPPDRDWKTSLRADQSLGGVDEPGATSSNPMMHRTKSVDFVVVISGEIVSLLDDSEVVLRAGDVMVQRGTNHAWSNRSTAPCVVAFVLIDAMGYPGLVAH